MLERHNPVASQDVGAVRAGLRAGTCTVSSRSPGHARGPGLLQTYRARAAHLAQFGTEHACTLRREAERLCDRLAVAGDVECRLWAFELEHGRSVHFIENAETGELFSVLHAADRRKVTPDEWSALWGTDVDAERAWRQEVARMREPDDPKDGSL